MALAAVAIPWSFAAHGADQGQDTNDTTWALAQAYEALNGRDIVIRIYPDAVSDPGKFVKVTAPLTGVTVKFEAIRGDHPPVSERVRYLIWAEDQTDQAVAEVLGRHIHVGPYHEQEQQSIWSLPADQKYEPYWTFLDALGKPIPRASVDVALSWSMDEIPLFKATLDEQGRLRRRLAGGATFVIKVEHPDYGAARVYYMNSQDHISGVYVVPLVRLDSQAVTASIQGTVVDNDGNAVPDAVVTCTGLVRPGRQPEQAYRAIFSSAVTNNQGWFAMCLPIMTEQLEIKGLPEPGTKYLIHIEPPKSSNLRQTNPFEPMTVVAGTQTTFTLTRMDANESFHTFAFEYAEGPVTSVDELKKIELLLMRDGREWARLGYERWKDGCSLPPGTLHAITQRWDDTFSFQEIALTADSPEHLVFTARPAIIYRGKVVSGVTGEPIPGALVLSGYPHDFTDLCALKDQQWQRLRDDASRQAMDRTPQALYRWRERATTTRPDGTFEITFMPGFNRELVGLTAIAPGYRRGPMPASGLPPNAEGTTEIGTVSLLPLDYQRRLPTFVFEDETGPVTDPNKLDRVRVDVETSGGGMDQVRWQDFSQEPGFLTGIYYAEAVWGAKRYTFEPVDLREGRPQTVVFRPKKIEPVAVMYKGAVIHGITGKPIEGAAVVLCRMTARGDTSGLSAEEWAAIRALGPKLDIGNPNLTLLIGDVAASGRPAATMIQGLTQTDSEGRYTLACERDNRPTGSQLVVVAQDFVGATQQVYRAVRSEGGPGHRPQIEQLPADENGVVSIQPLKLFPAGIVAFQPMIPDPGYEDPQERLRFNWTILPDGNQPYEVQSLYGNFRDNGGVNPFCAYEVQPNVTQTRYVPAGMNLRIMLQLIPRTTVPPAHFENIRLAQGQVLDLGRAELKPGVPVVVKVVDSAGTPISNERIGCVYEDGFQWMPPERTDADGKITIGVPANSTGQFRIGRYVEQTQMHVESSTPYTVAGQEDAGKEFTLQLSDELVQLLLGERP
jgi:hypothetical protein